ncbi:MAG: sulfatase [Actinomycetota bacterium]|nr:sulfatase [Actinomycetota bacterium]
MWARRSYLGLGVLAGALTLFGCGGGSGAERAPAPATAAEPNIVFVLLDDATKEQYSAESMPFTWEYMRRHATTFSDYLVTSPLCCPARASITTGQYGHNSGVLANVYGAIDDPQNILPVWLQQSGYGTAHVGKYLNNYENDLDAPADVAPGWDEWLTQLEPQRYFGYELSDNGEAVRFGNADDDYLTRVLNARAVEVAEDFARRDERFYLQLDQFAPHFAGGQDGRCKGAAEPDPRDERAFSQAGVPRAPALFEQDRRDKPEFIRSMPRGSGKALRAADVRYACALESLRAVDRGFEEIISTLEEHGALDETAIVLSSDNGLYYGEHGIPGEKHFPYREAYEVPLQIALPRSPGNGQPARVDAPTASIDLAPTFLELAGGKPCAEPGDCRALDGRSLLGLMRRGDGAGDWAGRARGLELTLDENNEPYDRTCEYFGVRWKRWAYVKHVTAARRGGECRPSGERELYDLSKDPFQLRNVAAGEPKSARRLHRLAVAVRKCEGGQCRRLDRAR